MQKWGGKPWAALVFRELNRELASSLVLEFPVCQHSNTPSTAYVVSYNPRVLLFVFFACFVV
jgi:hypothetical protein